MKLEINKIDLLVLMGKTQNIVEKRNAMPILVNILIEANGSVLKVYATDLEVSLTDSVPAKIQEPGKVVVSAKNLFEIGKELSEGPILLTKKENNWLEIKQGKYVSRIVGIDAEEYPIFPACLGTSFIEMSSEMMKEMIDKTIYSVSSDETRYHLNGVYFEINPHKGFKMVATDGHRLSLIKKDIELADPIVGQGVIVPKKGLYEIKKVIDGVDGVIHIAIEGSQFVVQNGTTTLMIRLIEGRYPNYQQFIPQSFSKKATVNRESLLSSLKRVSLLANQKSKAVFFNFTKEKVEVSTNNPEMGDASEELEINYEGADLRVGFSAKYMTDILSNMSEESVTIELTDELSPATISHLGDKNYLAVIMPMRT